MTLSFVCFLQSSLRALGKRRGLQGIVEHEADGDWEGKPAVLEMQQGLEARGSGPQGGDAQRPVGVVVDVLFHN